MDNFIETVRVVSELSKGNPTGYVTINKCDMTTEYELFVEPLDGSFLIGDSIIANQITDGQFASGVIPEAPLVPPADALVEPVLTGNEQVKLSDNDPDTTAAVKKPWDTN